MPSRSDRLRSAQDTASSKASAMLAQGSQDFAMQSGTDQHAAKGAAQPSGVGRLNPSVLAPERLPVNGVDLLLFGPISSGEGLPAGRSTYQYQAPVRVASVEFDRGDNRVKVGLDLTVPSLIKEEESNRLALKLVEPGVQAPRVNLQPLPIRSYVVELAYDETEGVLRIGSSGEGEGIIVPTPDKTFTAVVPASMPALRKILETRPAKATVRLRSEYDFERVAQGSVSLVRVGNAVHRVLEEVRPKFPDGQAPVELYLDRHARDGIRLKIDQAIEKTENNNGLDAKAWDSLLAEGEKFVDEYFATLPRIDAHAAITTGMNMALVFTAESGRLDAKPILSKDKINFKEKSEEYSRKANEDLKVVRDILRKGAFDKSSHKEMRDKLNIDTGAKAGITSFSGAAHLKLEKSSEQITVDEWKTMNDNRDYWLDDAKRSEEISSKVYEKILGEMNLEKSIAKIVDLYRLDERELTSRVQTRLTRSLVQGIEGLTIVTETALMVQPSDALAVLGKQIDAIKAEMDKNRDAIITEALKQREVIARLEKRQLDGIAKAVSGQWKVDTSTFTVSSVGSGGEYEFGPRSSPTVHWFRKRFGKEVKAVIGVPINNIPDQAKFDLLDFGFGKDEDKNLIFVNGYVLTGSTGRVRYRMIVFYVE